MQVKKQELAAAILAKFSDFGVRTQLDFTAFLNRNGLKISQPTVSRFIAGNYKGVPTRLKQLCSYSNIDLHRFILKVNPRQSPKLMNALYLAWDGSTEGENFLAQVIRAAGRLSVAGDSKN